jgi:aspartate--ammonia ligase
MTLRVERPIPRASELILPSQYANSLTVQAAERAIKQIKDSFERRLAEALNLQRITAPLFVAADSGINDHLSGVEQPVSFVIKALGQRAEIVQSLAKWKRLALGEYGFAHGQGFYTDMNAIRPDETLDNLHSIYVDQWDWERVIAAEERSLAFLAEIVGRIYGVIAATEREVCAAFPALLGPYLPDQIHMVHSEDLEARYPALTPKEREDAICREQGAVFVVGIGAPLADGRPHDGRAADYDDWSTPTGGGRRGLNGDILVWYPVLERAVELSSMGIRVDRAALQYQLAAKGEEFKRDLYFHQRLLNDELPLCIGGGIGQSRLCMLFLRRAHIGEIQASIWPREMVARCRAHNIVLL